MDIVAVFVKQIDSNIYQIIGTSDNNTEFIYNALCSKVAELAEIAEENNAIPLQGYVAHTFPQKLTVHATFQFLSNADVESFLNAFG